MDQMKSTVLTITLDIKMRCKVKYIAFQQLFYQQFCASFLSFCNQISLQFFLSVLLSDIQLLVYTQLQLKAISNHIVIQLVNVYTSVAFGHLDAYKDEKLRMSAYPFFFFQPKVSMCSKIVNSRFCQKSSKLILSTGELTFKKYLRPAPKHKQTITEEKSILS